LVGVFLVSHRRIASEMVESAKDILGRGLRVELIEVMPNSDIEELNKKILEGISNMLKECDSVLLLTDMVGSTPTNMAFNSAVKFIEGGKKVRVITGFNLPVLITVLTYQRDMTIDKLAEKALETGKMTLIDLTRRFNRSEEN